MDDPKLAALAKPDDVAPLDGATCDACTKPATRYLKRTGVRACESAACATKLEPLATMIAARRSRQATRAS